MRNNIHAYSNENNSLDLEVQFINRIINRIIKYNTMCPEKRRFLIYGGERKHFKYPHPPIRKN